jgi:DNA uptake protein ComE-like DNA-binding protein
MNFDITPVRTWFGYTRRERRASFILLILIVFVISVRFLVPDKKISIENIPLDIQEYSTDTVPVLKSKERGIPGNKPEVRNSKPFIADINRCDTSELIKLPGIGPVLSARIIKYRQLLGGYASKEQLREVYGLPGETYDLIKDMVSADTLLILKININTTDYKRLDRMPYFERSEINSILKYREMAGRIRNINELVDNKVLSREKAGKVRPYLIFD